MLESIATQDSVSLSPQAASSDAQNTAVRNPSAIQGTGATDPARSDADSPRSANGRQADSVDISDEARKIAELAARDREVRAHEAAHAAVGGQYAGAPSLTYEKGPDGRSYATGGEVRISVSKVSGDPQATLEKAQIVRAAALAPAQPSAQDMRVAAKAAAMETEALAEIANENHGQLDNDNPAAAKPAAPPAVNDGAAAPAPTRHRVQLYA